MQRLGSGTPCSTLAGLLSTMPAMHWSDAFIVSSPYRWTMLGAIVLSAVLWFYRTKRNTDMLVVYVGALGGAFLGAKLAYIFAEWQVIWPSPERWLMMATGKSVVGGILGGYAGVEGMKRAIGHEKSTGDLFAPIIPLGIALGRVGCVLHGCCLGNAMPVAWWTVNDVHGQARWPSSQIELVFQLVMFAVTVMLLRRLSWQGRVFFLYLFCYGVFRFFHEWLRDTPKWFGWISGYQLLALVMLWLGLRKMHRKPTETEG